MSFGWNFPGNNYGQITGIGEAGIETFKGTPYSSLAREICQNSLDARLDESEPVIVEFKKHIIETEKIPGIFQLKDALKRCKVFWECHNNKKTVNFFNKSLGVVNKNKIRVLRISDFNTTGLTGSKKEYNTPWQNLVKASGVSDKAGSAGGSFGIGKSAPFACSDLRTIFYSTLDSEDVQATQGVARLVSFSKDNNEITQGTGYYGIREKNTSIPEQLIIDNEFKRNDLTGTDIYIIGFIDDDEWEKEMIKSTLEGFLISIYQEKLIVKIENILISKTTLPLYISEYKDIAKFAYNYYQVLTSKDTKKITKFFNDLGNIELYILLGTDFHRKVLISRSSGMKIFDKQNISSTINFAGILILRDEKINAYFREMETPQHNAWEPDRFDDLQKVKKAKKNCKELYKYIKDTIIEIGRNTADEEIDAEGVGQYLPDELYLEQNQNQAEKYEAITDKTKDIDVKIVDITSISRGFEKHRKENITEWYEGFDKNNNTTNDTNHSSNEKGKRKTDNDNDNKDKITKKEISVGISNIRLFVIDNRENRYRLIFVPEKSVANGYVRLNLSGEQSNVTANVKNAYLNGDIKTKLKCVKENIYIGNIKEKQKVNITFALDYIENCSMEVTLLGYTS
ncbi:hypothetical protein GJ688_18045 [Heliobacillus mobilis]|uniref:Uncharacterized protein n=1 Tax=Heliobacterium mobile TaxID=28064 RepID=A0A6I3SQ29_HELMO|nr:hypothetical protein [Heliobacterium mobile]MTV50836.1 hypothetical protein [Heliobacterium mobile]